MGGTGGWRADADTGYRAVFDRLFARGERAVRPCTHYRDTPPADGGRWGISVVLLPDAAGSRR